jgi:hypothetical protein
LRRAAEKRAVLDKNMLFIGTCAGFAIRQAYRYADFDDIRRPGVQ